MKKKKVLPVIILIIILIGLTVAYSLLKKSNEEKSETTEEPSYKAVDIDSEAIKKTNIKNSKGEMNFEYDESALKWKNADDESFNTDSTKIDSIVISACALEVVRELDNSLDNITEYGLDNPSITLAMTDGDGNETKINIGDCNANSGNYYMYVEGTEKVYMISTSLPTSLDVSLSDMEETTTEAATETEAETTESTEETTEAETE